MAESENSFAVSKVAIISKNILGQIFILIDFERKNRRSSYLVYLKSIIFHMNW